MNLESAVGRKARLFQSCFHFFFTADENGLAKALLLEGVGCADDGLGFAFREYDAFLFRRAAKRGIHLLQKRRGWVRASRETLRISREIFDRFARNPGVGRRFSDGRRNG